jgi:hypothetical protein
MPRARTELVLEDAPRLLDVQPVAPQLGTRTVSKLRDGRLTRQLGQEATPADDVEAPRRPVRLKQPRPGNHAVRALVRRGQRVRLARGAKHTALPPLARRLVHKVADVVARRQRRQRQRARAAVRQRSAAGAHQPRKHCVCDCRSPGKHLRRLHRRVGRVILARQRRHSAAQCAAVRDVQRPILRRQLHRLLHRFNPRGWAHEQHVQHIGAEGDVI